MEELFTYIKKFGTLNPQDELLIAEGIQEITVKKGEPFVEAGKVSQRIAFVKEGVFRSLYYNKQGDDFTRYFIYEGRFIGDFQGFTDQLPAHEDIEAITDFAIYSTLLKLAVKYNIKYILSGNNIITEQVLPRSWIFKDNKNLIDIHSKFGKVKLKTLPLFSRNKMRFINKWHGIEVIELLNYMDYNKEQVKKTIIQELDWKDYGGKHYESIFTRFYQGYILPNKFKIDKRKAHLSNLIFSGQITKEEAIEELKKPMYNDEMEKEDKEFVLKKLGLREFEFEMLMSLPPKSHKDFNYTKAFFEQYPYLKIFRPLWKIINRKKD